MAVSRTAKLRIVAGIGVLLLLVGLWQGLYFWWRKGYAKGTMTGVVRKVSVNGSPLCKFLTGQISLQGSNPLQQSEVVRFSVDDDSDSNPIVKDLKAAEAAGIRVTLHYREDKKMWWRCSPAELFVTSVEK